MQSEMSYFRSISFTGLFERWDSGFLPLKGSMSQVVSFDPGNPQFAEFRKYPNPHCSPTHANEETTVPGNQKAQDLTTHIP